MNDNEYKSGSLSLVDAVSMGTGVMVGAGIFALTGQVAELAGNLFPYAFAVAAIVAGFSAYAYTKLAHAYPSAGGIGMFLVKEYGKGLVAAVFALVMALTMVINESLVARTFGTYALQPFDVGAAQHWIVPGLGVAILIFALALNMSGNNIIGKFSLATAIVKIGGVSVFALAALWVSQNVTPHKTAEPVKSEPLGFLAAVAIGVLAYKGFTTITNSGDEITEPRKNIGRAIAISLGICAAIYVLVAVAVSANLSVPDIISAKNFALAQATRPALGSVGLWFTVAIALVATAAGLIASTFAVSRMLAMVTDMKLIPHRHFGMSGRIQKHTLVYAIVSATLLTIFLDLSRIAGLGIVLYLVMDIAIQWGVLWKLKDEVKANPWIVGAAILLDTVVLVAFTLVKLKSDPLILVLSVLLFVAVVIGEWIFLRKNPIHDDTPANSIMESHNHHQTQ